MPDVGKTSFVWSHHFGRRVDANHLLSEAQGDLLVFPELRQTDQNAIAALFARQIFLRKWRRLVGQFRRKAMVACAPP